MAAVPGRGGCRCWLAGAGGLVPGPFGINISGVPAVTVVTAGVPGGRGVRMAAPRHRGAGACLLELGSGGRGAG